MGYLRFQMQKKDIDKYKRWNDNRSSIVTIVIIKLIIMKTNFSISLKNHRFPGQMPEICLYCGKPGNDIIKSDLEIEEKKGDKTIKHPISIPRHYCKEHAGIAKRNATIEIMLFILSLIPGLALAVWMWIHISENGIFGVTEGGLLVFFLIIGAVAGLWIGSKITMFVLYWLKTLFGKLFMKTSLDNPLGLMIELRQNPDAVFMKFANPEVAEKFYELNRDLMADEKITA